MRATGLLLALIVLAGVILTGALWSTAGNRLIVRLAEDALAPALSVTGVSGSVLSRLCAETVRFDAEGVQVYVEDVCVNPRLWSSFDFLKVDLVSVQALSARITTTPTSESAEPTVLSLPIDISVDALDLERLVINALVLDGVQAELNLSDADLALTARFAYERVPVQLSTTGGWSDLQVTGEAYGAELEGALDLVSDGLPWRARISARSLDLTEFVDRATELNGLAFEGSGDLERYRFGVTGRVEDAAGSGAFSLSGAGDLEQIEFDRVDLSYVRLVDLPVQVDVWRSAAFLDWSEGIHLRLDEPTLVGRVDGLELSASAERVVVTDAELNLMAVTATIGERAAVQLAGRVGFDGRMSLSGATTGFPLNLIDPRLDGLADIQATLDGSMAEPAVRAEGGIRDLAWASEVIGDLSAVVEGSQQSGTGRLQVSSEIGEAELSLGYEQSSDAYQIRLAEAAGLYPALGARAELLEPLVITAGTDRVAFEQACVLLSSDQLDAEPGRLCADLDYPGGGLQLDLETWEVPESALPNSDVSLLGKVRLTVDLTGFTPLDGSASVSLTDLVAQHPDLAPLRLGDLDARVSMKGDQLQATLNSPPGETQELLLNGALEVLLAEEVLDSGIAGSIYMELDGIWVAQSLLPMEVAYELDNVRGLMSVNSVVSGSVRDPVIDGSFKLSNAGWQVLALNSDFHDLQAQATMKGSERIDFNSTSGVGEGRLSFKGDIVGLNSDAPRLSTSVSLQGAELVDLPDYEAAVDGDLALEMGTERLSLTGSLHLPRARIVIADLPESAVTASADEVIVDMQQEATAQQVRRSDVTLTLGDEVYLEAFGLSGRLSGNLRVQEEPGRLRTVTGVINLNRARFEAYGQELIVERGQLTFSGPVDDPAVDVVATRIVDYDDREYRVSLLITGTANDLETEVVSQPSLSEDDALALLITGRTFSQISSSEQSNVSGAAISMGLLSATGVTQNLADALNLEEIIVDQDTDGNMEVGAAVRLNRNIYLRYTYGVFSRIGGVLLRYRFSKRFSVQAKTGDAHSIELRYGVDD